MTFENKVEKYLDSLDIEFLAESKYTVACPKCKDTRGKESKSLQVYIEEPYVRYRCYHAQQCEWNELQFKKLTGERVMIKPQETMVHIPEGSKIPSSKGSTIYEYRNKNNDWLYCIIRTKDKKFFPMSYNTDGEFVQKARNIKTLYRAEHLSDTNKVIVVEGEKAADAAAKIFTTADIVTWAGGANGMTRGDWSLLKNRYVVLWPDNDAPGVKAMMTIANMIDTREVYIVDVSSLDPKADLADEISLDKLKEIYAGRKNIAKALVEGSINEQSFIESVTKIKTGLKLGWANMDKTLRLPQSGLTIVEGRSGHGKTTFMVNTAVNLLENTDRKIVFLSYEMPSTRMLIKLLMCVEGAQLDPVPHKNEEKYRETLLKGDLKAWDTVKGWLGNRLYITDDAMTLDKIRATLDRDEMQDAVVFVDYIQLIPSTSKESRYLVIKQFADVLREISNKRNQVVMAGSQLTNGESPYQDSAREGKDIMNAAELVFKVWNKDVAEAHDTVKRTKTKSGEEEVNHYYDKADGNFVIDIKKNRNGTVGVQYGFNLKYGVKLLEVNDKYKEF